jgi:hypothetical protein
MTFYPAPTGRGVCIDQPVQRCPKAILVSRYKKMSACPAAGEPLPTAGLTLERGRSQSGFVSRQ